MLKNDCFSCTHLPRFVLHASISGYLVFRRLWKRKKWTRIYLHASMSGYTCMQLWDMRLQDFQNVEFCLKNWLKCVPFNLYLYKWPKTNHYLSNKPIILKSKVFGCRSTCPSNLKQCEKVCNQILQIQNFLRKNVKKVTRLYLHASVSEYTCMQAYPGGNTKRGNWVCFCHDENFCHDRSLPLGRLIP